MNELIKELYDKDDKAAYKKLQELELEISESNKLYKFFDEILEMLDDDKSFVRVRGFRLICALAKWDEENLIEKNIDKILDELDDEKATAVRQCLDKLSLIIMYKPKLEEKIEKKLKGLDLSKYKETMKPLIEKDIEKIMKIL